MTERISSSGMGIGPPEMWATMSGWAPVTTSWPATREEPLRDTPPEWILIRIPRSSAQRR